MQTWFQKDYVRPCIRLLCRLLLTLLALFILMRVIPTVFSFFLPFILAFLVAHAMNPLLCLLQSKWKASRGVLSMLMLVVSLLFIATIVGGFIYTLVREIVILAQNIDGVMEYFSQIVATLSDRLYWLLDYLPTGADEMLSGITYGFMAWIQAQGTAFADTVIAHTVTVGGGVVTVVIFVMASYFIMADYPHLVEKLKSLFSQKTYKGYSTLKNATLSALGGYLRAQFLMAFVAFLLSLAAFLIIGQEFALLLAILMGFLDFLPIVGTSIVLAPWAIVNIIAGSHAMGIYLFALSLVSFLLRRIIEPKIVGSQMGLSPLAALTSIYVGMQLGGVIGLILGPIIAMVLVSLYKAGLFKGWVKDIKAVLDLRK